MEHNEEHEHHHEHGEECHCHEHGHHHEHVVHEEMVCGHCGRKYSECTCSSKELHGMIRKVYILENLGCANCAAKMEAGINSLTEVENATITFATKLLCVTAPKETDWSELACEMQKICQSIEGEVKLVERKSGKKYSEPVNDKNERSGLIVLIACAIIFVAVEVYHEVFAGGEMSLPLIIIFAAVYLVLGKNVLRTAFMNLLHGRIFDENFLMSIATLGAFAIKEYPEAVGVMLFYRIGEMFEEMAVAKSRSQIMDTIDLRPEKALRMHGDDFESIDASDIMVGDVLLVRPGDRIPVDGVIVEGKSRIDTSAVTGEPVLVSAENGTEVVSGCVNTEGTIKIKAKKVLADSMVQRILDSVENAVASKHEIDRFITRFARVYTPIVVLVALFTAIGMPLIKGEDFYPYVYTALTFLVMSCPCALVLSVPLAFFCGIGAGSKHGILFKGGVVMEALTRVKAVIMDKTGTITEGNFVVQQVNPFNGFTKEEVLKLAASAEAASTHPIAMSIVAKAKEEGTWYGILEAREIAGHGIKAETKDGRVILCGNRKLLSDNEVCVNDTAGNAMGAEVYIAVDGVYAGNIVIADTIKKDSKAAIEAVKALEIKSFMLTGDTMKNAEAVASYMGIDGVYAKLLPEEKLNKLREIREKNGAVMFVGDGINDAPVLAGADVGAAMGSGADAALEASDVVFLHSDLSSVPRAIDIAKKTMSIAMQNVVFALAIKIAVMVLGITGIYSNMWLAVFADTGVAFLCILNSVRAMRIR